ncbi:hypothetical protein SAMN02745248_01136 [Hathewaya proteolytica DSM 3090]|uniref:Uncharacterized protein n=1 Tax=Hathewaya proteolytica DSM 3090 TaxID=1121331 RepID=A0A1M6MRT3_9CLOT|nr:hypothetical protein [Hathewaya proteolytica]SHJ86122.1 hypothetical protein SAMN02745248_01136 [Hathewaya proteolytica DSM 3090]
MYKFKKIIAIFSILNSVFIMGCGVKNDQKAEIQLWWYEHGVENMIDHNEKEVIYNTRAIIDRVKSYCDSNKIPLKMNVYTSSQISYENYILKRNVNLSKDNVIIMDKSSSLYELNENHCDYNKISNYKNLYTTLEKLSFIPLDMNIEMFAIDTELLGKYSAKLDKNVISYNEYLDVVNKMRTNGYVGGFLNTKLNLKKENLFSSSPKIRDENINIKKYKRVINECIKETQNISAKTMKY